MKLQESIHIHSSPPMVFAQYMKVDTWHEWDKGVKHASLKNALAVGAKGVLKPSKGPQGSFKITEMTRNQSFTTESKLPLCRITFEHTLQASGDNTLVIHTVTFSGLTRFLFSRLIGKQIKNDLPQALLGLKQKCEGTL